MTLSELLEALAERGSTVAVEYGRLRHRGPRIGADDPLRGPLATFYDEVLWLLMSARLCVFCPRLLAEDDRTLCPRHRHLSDALPPVWMPARGGSAPAAGRSGGASSHASPLRPNTVAVRA